MGTISLPMVQRTRALLAEVTKPELSCLTGHLQTWKPGYPWPVPWTSFICQETLPCAGFPPSRVWMNLGFLSALPAATQPSAAWTWYRLLKQIIKRLQHKFVIGPTKFPQGGFGGSRFCLCPFKTFKQLLPDRVAVRPPFDLHSPARQQSQ